MRQTIRKFSIGSAVATACLLISAAGVNGFAGHIRSVPWDYRTIQSAVNAAQAGDTVLVASGVYRENVVVSTSGVRLIGDEDVVIEGNGRGIGIAIVGAANAPITDVEVSNFEVRQFVRGLVVQTASDVRVSHNYVHDNLAIVPPDDPKFVPPLGDGTGIELLGTSDSDVSHNVVSANGFGGINVRAGSTYDAVHHNRVLENASQTYPNFDSSAILVTGPAGQGDRIEYNQIERNDGRGIAVTRPPGAVPITGVLIAHNRLHGNQRAGVAIMFAATGNTVIDNDARNNNLSQLPPCYRCNLFDNSIGKDGGNVWEKNFGTFSGTELCDR